MNAKYIGDTYGRLTVLDVWRDHSRKLTMANCECACGKQHVAPLVEMRRGAVKSCGCLKRDVDSARMKQFATRHGESKSPTYGPWRAMRARCYDSENAAYPMYGGRGIRVCDRWKYSFEAFLADMGERPAGHSIDRIDVNGNYEPGNCRWATLDEQRLNKRNSRYVEYGGERVPLRDLSARLGISYQTLHSRLVRGSPVAIDATPTRSER